MVAAKHCPATVEELSEAVRSLERLSIVGGDGHRSWRVEKPGEAAILSLSKLLGIVQVEPADQVAIVRAGTPVSQVRAELEQLGQTLPYAPFEEGDDPTVGGALSLALPHRLEGACGTWRDWTLGMTVVRPDGEIAKCGSCAVKSVAGYDVARLFIGARGSLGVIAEVILKTYPLRALPEPSCPSFKEPSGPRWVQRVPLSQAQKLAGGVVDPDTATLWAALPPDTVLPRFEGDWIIRSGCGRANLDPVRHPEFVRRAKGIFDPTGKLNPGALGE